MCALVFVHVCVDGFKIVAIYYCCEMRPHDSGEKSKEIGMNNMRLKRLLFYFLVNIC